MMIRWTRNTERHEIVLLKKTLQAGDILTARECWLLVAASWWLLREISR